MAFLNDRCARIPLFSYYKDNGFDFMFSTEEQEKQYRHIAAPGQLHTRLMFFDLMQIAARI